jgi:beta-fructofuranosidase
LCVSKDLRDWQYKDPFYAPCIDVGAHECPDIFRIGDWWYHVYSTYTGFYATVYRMSRSLEGPWIIPETETLDCRAFYAGKTASDGKNRYLFGWTPSREASYYQDWNPRNYSGNDYNVFDWGGSLVVHELVQHADGTLGTKIPETIEKHFNFDEDIEMTPVLGDWQFQETAASCNSEGFAALLMGLMPSTCMVSLKIKFDTNMRRCGIILRADDNLDKAYYISLDAQLDRLVFSSYKMQTDQGWRYIPYMTELERPLKLEPGKSYTIKVLVEDSICVTYVNDEVALTSRIYDIKKGQWGGYTVGGHIEFSDIQLSQGKEKGD